MKARCGYAPRCPTRSASTRLRSSRRKSATFSIKYPQVTVVGSELGRPDDGTDPTGFFNCEFYVGLKPYDDKTWRSGKIHTKEELSRDVEKKLSAYPGVIFNFTQPAEDAVDEALTGLKSALAVKIFGPGPGRAREKSRRNPQRARSSTPGFTELTVVRELGQPSLIVDADRQKIARYGINVADVEAVVQAAVGGQAATQVIQGEKLFDLVVRMEPQYRSNAQQIGNLLVPTPDGQQIPLSELATIKEAERRFLHLSRKQFALHRHSVFGYGSRPRRHRRSWTASSRASPFTCRKAIVLIGAANTANCWKPSQQFYIIGPLAIFLIFLILFALYGNFKFPVTIALGVVLTEPVGALIALKLLAHAVQRLERPRPARIARCFRRNRGHSRQLHQ